LNGIGQYWAVRPFATLNLHLLVQNRSLDLLCVIPDGLALGIQTQTTLTLLGGADPIVANEVRVHGLLATGILVAIKRNFTGPNGSYRTICSFAPVSSPNCHFLAANLQLASKPTVRSNRIHSYIFWVPARYLSHMTSFIRTPSPDTLIEHLIQELQSTGTKCDTAQNFNAVYPDGK
jgi:hypothetical protein